jgi:Tol biopolymer transport system component
VEFLEDRTLLASVQLVSAAHPDLLSEGANGSLDEYSNSYNADWRNPISADGRYVVFRSSVTNLVSGLDIEPVSNIYRFDRLTGEVLLVSVNKDGTGSANGTCGHPTISADGSVVAFQSAASNLHLLDTDTTGDVFVRDLKTGTTHLISVNKDGNGSGNNSSYRPVLSSDGSVVAFASTASNLHLLDTDTVWDTFARDLNTGTTYLISVNKDGTGSGNRSSGSGTFSADGSVVAFRSTADNLVERDYGYQDVFLNVIDKRNPMVAGLSPASNAVGVPTDTDLMITFDEPIRVDGATVTIALAAPLPGLTSFYVLVSAGSFRDLSGNDFAGIPDPTDWTFETSEHEDSLVGVQMVAVAAPSAVAAAALPSSLETVALGSTYYVEIWVQDRWVPGVGITGGKVDLGYTTAVADALNVVNLDFDMFPDGVIDDANGLVRDLGGGRLDGGLGIAPQWTRLGYVEFVATDVGQATFELSAGSMQFSRFGAGTVAWDLVDWGTPIVLDQIEGTQIEMTIVHQPSTTDANGEVTALPASADWVHEWQSFWVEIWVSTADPTLGVTEAAVDLQYDSNCLTAEQIGKFGVSGC